MVQYGGADFTGRYLDEMEFPSEVDTDWAEVHRVLMQKVFPRQPVVATDGTWRDVVEQSPIPVLVDFWAPWCGPCRAVAPALEAVASERGGKLKIVKVNVDENPRVAGLHGIRSIPAFKLFRGPLELDQQVGALSKDAFDLWLERYI